MFSGFVYFVACISTYSCLWPNNILSCEFVYSLISWIPELLLFFLIKQCFHEHSCTNFYIDVFSCLLVVFLGVELLGHTVALFNILRNCQTVFQNNCPILHSNHQYMRVPPTHTLANTFYSLSFGFSCPGGHEMLS